jgi:ornithine decarboxylase
MPNIQAATIPIPFAKFLKIVAIVDPASAQTCELLDRLRAANYEVEVTDRYERDVSEDAAVARTSR